MISQAYSNGAINMLGAIDHLPIKIIDIKRSTCAFIISNNHTFLRVSGWFQNPTSSAFPGTGRVSAVPRPFLKRDQKYDHMKLKEKVKLYSTTFSRNPYEQYCNPNYGQHDGI